MSVSQSITSYVRFRMCVCFFRSRMLVSRSITGRPTTEMVFLNRSVLYILLFRLVVSDHVCNRVKHGNVTQLDTIPVD
jgi:hypothetical protein